MSDEATLPENPPPATTPPAAPAQQPATNVLDTPEVRAAITAAEERARNATWKQARETLGKKQSGAAPSTPIAPTEPQPTAAPAIGLSIQDIVRVSAFTAAATEHGITPRGVELLLGEFMAAKPSDPRAWAIEQAEAIGVKKPTTVNPNPPAASSTPASTPASPAPVGTPTPTPGGPPPAPASGLYRPPVWEWPQSEIDAYLRKHGAAALTRQWTQDASARGVQMPKR